MNLYEGRDVNPHANEPRDDTEEEVSEEAAVTESIESPQNDAAIESLKSDDK